MYPLKFSNIAIKKPWAGQALRQDFGKDFSDTGRIGESWELSGYEANISLVENGYFKGKNLYDVLEAIYGDYPQVFPLLIKLLDVKDKLSIQVHPDGNYQKELATGCMGKHECWYILDTYENPEVICGLKPGVTRVDLIDAIQKNRLLECLSSFPVKPHDVINIPPRVIHGARGIVFYELQQTSNSSYRLYDWGSDRTLHLHDALCVINFEPLYPSCLIRSSNNLQITAETNLLTTEYFKLDRLNIESTIKCYIPKGNFHVLTSLAGHVMISSHGTNLSLKIGESVLLLDKLKEYVVVNISPEPVMLLRASL